MDINTLLAVAGFPMHQEREVIEGTLDGIAVPWSCAVGRHSTLHALRRFYAHVLDRRDRDRLGHAVLPEVQIDGRAADDPLLKRAYDADSDNASPFHGSHLIQHADDCGYYVPVDFPMALSPEQFPALNVWNRLQSNLGSSFGLSRECQEVATLLELDLTQADLRKDAMGTFSELEAALCTLPSNEQPIWFRDGYITEALACWVLYHGALASIRTGLTLCFV